MFVCRCKFDDSLSHGEQISSVLAICEAPGEERRAISNTFLHFTLASNSLFLSVQTLFRSVQTLFMVGKRTLREESNFREASSLLQIGGGHKHFLTSLESSEELTFSSSHRWISWTDQIHGHRQQS